MKKRFYIMFVSRDENGDLNKVPVPLHYAYMFVAAAIIGIFTITGLAGSYSRMLIKTARFNQLRQDHNSLQKDYAHLEKAAHEKDVEAASLGSLASEISALYGLTASKLAIPMGHVTRGKSAAPAPAQLVETVTLADTDTTYYKSLDAFYALRTSALNGSAARTLSIGTSSVSTLTSIVGGLGLGDLTSTSYAPTLWPILGPITSGFGQREDPILGNGEGEFHKGVDISSPLGTPVRVTGDGTVKLADRSNGYGQTVVIDHGHGVETVYGHLSGYAVMAGQTVVRGQVVGYVGHSGRTTGNHLHYEVRIRNTAVNPHKYLRTTMADLGGTIIAGN